MRQDMIGSVRGMDSGGKVSLPKVFRTRAGIKEGEYVVFTLGEDGEVIVQSYKSRRCIFCDRTMEDLGEDEFITFEGKVICRSCVGDLKRLFKAQQTIMAAQ